MKTHKAALRGFIDDNPAIGGASQLNSMPVPSPGKWGGKPENPA